MGRLHRPGRAELALWLCTAALLCTAASWPGTLVRSYKGSGAGAGAPAEPPRTVRAQALVIREERVLELPEGTVLLAEPGKRLAAGTAYAAAAPDAAALEGQLKAWRLAGMEDRPAALAEARCSGSFALMSAALSGSAPEPDMTGAQPIFAGEAGLLCEGVDGLEGLGPDAASGLDGAGLRGLLAQADAQAGPGLRLVTGLRWYCALLTDEPAEPGSRLSLRLDGEEFAARVESSGEGVLLLSCTEGMAELAGIRRAQAEIELP